MWVINYRGSGQKQEGTQEAVTVNQVREDGWYFWSGVLAMEKVRSGWIVDVFRGWTARCTAKLLREKGE